jgi:hypothetical protein
MSIRIIAALIIAALLAAGVWKIHHNGIVKGRAEVQSDWDRSKLQAIEKREVNRETARNAEIRYVDREKVRTEYLTTTQKELRDESKNLESCLLDAGDIGLLNSAANSTREN